MRDKTYLNVEYLSVYNNIYDEIEVNIKGDIQGTVDEGIEAISCVAMALVKSLIETHKLEETTQNLPTEKLIALDVIMGLIEVYGEELMIELPEHYKLRRTMQITEKAYNKLKEENNGK